MPEMNSPLGIYKLLNGSNCRKCMFPSCMAFAAAVFKGKKRIKDCPEIDTNTVKRFSGQTATLKRVEGGQRGAVDCLKQDVSKIDFASVAEKLGAIENCGKLAINCLGKDFIINNSGEMSSECHYNQWVHIPLLDYIAHGQGKSLSGDWLPFKQLNGAADWSRFFAHRCEEDMRQLVDAHTGLFFDLLHLLGGQPITGINGDHSLVLHPLPRLPMVIHYWIAEEDFDSKLNILFDRTAPDNLNIEYIYTITRGLVEMFRALIVKHSINGKLF